MPKSNKLTIIIDVDSADGKKSIRAINNEIDALGAQAEQSQRSVDQLFDHFGKAPLAAFGFNEIAEAMQRISGFAGEIVNMQADWNNLAARIKLATGSQEAANASMSRMVQIATDAHAPLTSVGELFARLALNVKRPKEELLDFTQAVTDSMLVAGTAPARRHRVKQIRPLKTTMQMTN